MNKEFMPQDTLRNNDPALPKSPVCHLRVWHSATSVEHRGEFESRCEKLLDPQELASADRFRRTTTRNQHVVGRAMARRLLGATNVAPQQIQFAAGAFGKPEVVTPPEAVLPFNIAHTDGLVLCGVANQQADLVGVDVESLDRRTSTDLAERYFAKPEIEFLRDKPADQQQYFFLRIWTLKEAFIKAIGTGLHTPLADFAFEGIDGDRPRIRFLEPGLERGKKWNFVCFQPREGFIAAAAIVAKEERSHVMVDWHPFEDLIEGCRESR
ncbi:MAG: 4'-phosphopantetheinyl transferase superfamily protein [Planctomycetales bacterium]|nr:4'-phosphopantetheinyl transferase superfamily protein [Planctomycetales bacterium]